MRTDEGNSVAKMSLNDCLGSQQSQDLNLGRPTPEHLDCFMYHFLNEIFFNVLSRKLGWVFGQKMKLPSGPRAWQVGICNQLRLLPSGRKDHLGPSVLLTCAVAPGPMQVHTQHWVSLWIISRGWNFSFCCTFISPSLAPAQCPPWGSTPGNPKNVFFFF